MIQNLSRDPVSKRRVLLTTLILLAGLLLIAAPAALADSAVQTPAKVTNHEQPIGGAEGASMPLGGVTSASVAAYATFDNPNYYYANITNAPDGTKYRQAGLSPDGTKIVAVKQVGTTPGTGWWEIVLMNADGSGATVISPGDSGTGDIYEYTNPFWSDDGTAIGFVEVHNANPNKVMVYNISGGTRSYIYEPVTTDVANPDFVGNSKTTIVFWAVGAGGAGADLFTWDGTTRINLTNTADYYEYEPVSNADGTKIVYWSGETPAESVNTTHTLTYSGGTWTKDVGFTPIADSYWAYWTTPAATQIALTVMSTGDISIYDNTGAFVTDLSGPAYSGGSGQWNFFGSMPQGPNGEYVLTSNAGRTNPALGRDIIIAAPRAALYVDDGGSDANPGTKAAPFKTIQKGINEVSGSTVNVAAGTYNESITINKSLTVLCAQANVNPVEGGRAGGESKISNQYAVQISANNVVLNGCEVADFRYGVNVNYDNYGFPPPDYKLHDITIAYNWIHATDAWVGFTTAPGLLQNLTITHNIIDVNNVTPGGDASALAAIGLSGGNSTDGHPTYENIVISDNDLRNLSPDGGYTLFSGAAPGAYLINGMVITGNRFRNVPEVGANLNLGNILNGQFTNNVVEDIGGSIGIDTGTISGNTFRNGAYLAVWGNEYGFTRPSKNLTVSNNDFTDEVYGRGFRVRTGADPSTIAVHNNAFRDSGLTPGVAPLPILGSFDGYVLINEGAGTLEATDNWWGAPTGPIAGRLSGSLTTSPWITGYADDPAKLAPPTEWPLSAESKQPGFWPLAPVTMQVSSSPAEVSDIVTMDTLVTSNNVYGMQLNVQFDPTELEFQAPPASSYNNVPAAGWYWDFIGETFAAVTGGRRLSGSMSTHTNPATLAGQSVATWKFKCLKAGTFDLTYDTTVGTGTYLATKDGFNIPAKLVNGQVTCLAATASVDGWIKLQGRQPTNPVPAAWQEADVTLTCVDSIGVGCYGFAPYTMTTDASGHYQHLKTATPGSGIVQGTYSATVARRAYLGAAKTANVVVGPGSNTINTLATAPRLLGGDVVPGLPGSGISIADLTAIGGVFGTTVTPPDTGNDVNGDGFINIFDLVLAGGNLDQPFPQPW
jgi:hypothetical protein